MDAQLLEALAEAFDAASLSLRQRAAVMTADSQPRTTRPQNAIERARAVHPMLGKRQTEVIAELESAGTAGTSTGVISRSIGYDQPNVYLTLRGLMSLGFVEKDESTNPHTYRLTSLLLGPESGEEFSKRGVS